MPFAAHRRRRFAGGDVCSCLRSIKRSHNRAGCILAITLVASCNFDLCEMFCPLRGVLENRSSVSSYPAGSFGTDGDGAHFICLAHLPISYATALGFLTPILALPLGFAMLGERITRVLIVASFWGLAGSS